jgi:hypothetical protein
MNFLKKIFLIGAPLPRCISLYWTTHRATGNKNGDYNVNTTSMRYSSMGLDQSHAANNSSLHVGALFHLPEQQLKSGV